MIMYTFHSFHTEKEQEERMYIHQFMFEMGAKRVETAHMGVVSSLKLLPPLIVMMMMMIITPLGKRRTFQLLPLLPPPPHHYIFVLHCRVKKLKITCITCRLIIQRVRIIIIISWVDYESSSSNHINFSFKTFPFVYVYIILLYVHQVNYCLLPHFKPPTIT